MTREVRIKLAKPIIGHEGPINEIVLKEPTCSLYFRLGDPISVVRDGDGKPFIVESPEIIEKYLERCLVTPDMLLLSQAPASVGREVKQALLGFFLQDEPTAEASPT